MALEIDVLTLFPEMISGPLGASIPGRIQERGLVMIRTHDLREWGLGRHRSVDDAPYGGGAGMVMRPNRSPPLSTRFVARIRSSSCSTREERPFAMSGPTISRRDLT